MGIFSFLRGNSKKKYPIKVHNDNSCTTEQLANSTAKLNLRKDKLKICLKKNDIDSIMAKVGLVLDKSGSMEDLYYNGTVQDVVERILPLGLKFDDNGEIDVWAFNNDAKSFEGVGESNYHDFIHGTVMPNTSWGGTYYCEPLQDIYLKYVKEEPSDLPSYILFVTDGEAMDKDDTRDIIKELQKHNIFVCFIGIGDEDFKFLKSMQKQYNVDFIKVQDINEISDEDLYEKIIHKFSKWVKKIQ